MNKLEYASVTTIQVIKLLDLMTITIGETTINMRTYQTPLLPPYSLGLISLMLITIPTTVTLSGTVTSKNSLRDMVERHHDV